ncbi:MAG: hypothetical protein PGN34_09745 [Methylobacterium frigidaeris]
MTPLSSLSSLPTSVPPPPSQRIQDQISAGTASGSISATDATALSDALESIDEGLSGASAPGSATRLDPSQMKGRIDDLIETQVSGGTLTSDQADTLKAMFAQAGGPGGPPPSGGAPGASSGGSGGDVSELMSGFLKQLQEQQSQTSLYGSGGSSASPTVSALLMDFQA